MSKKLPKDFYALGESLELIFKFRRVERYCHIKAYTLGTGRSSRRGAGLYNVSFALM